GAQHLAVRPARAVAAVGVAPPVPRLHDDRQGRLELHAAARADRHGRRPGHPELGVRRRAAVVVAGEPGGEARPAHPAPALVVLLRARLRRRLVGHGDHQDHRPAHHPQAGLAHPPGRGGERRGRAHGATDRGPRRRARQRHPPAEGRGMSGDTTSGRWVGRVLATGLTAAVGLGLTAGVAAADPTAAPAATQPVAAPTQLVTPDTAASVRRAWESRGRPHRMAVVRDHRIDVATEGRVTRQVGRAGGPLTLATLDRALPANWLTLDGDTATLDTTLVLTRGTSLRLGGNGSPRTLQLVGGAEPSDAASIHTGGGRIELTGVTVTSLDRETGQPLPATAKGRPSIVVSGGGRLDATDVTITDLGTVSEGTPGAEEDGAAAVE